jgi:hypothetical protein
MMRQVKEDLHFYLIEFGGADPWTSTKYRGGAMGPYSAVANLGRRRTFVDDAI